MDTKRDDPSNKLVPVDEAKLEEVSKAGDKESTSGEARSQDLREIISARKGRSRKRDSSISSASSSGSNGSDNRQRRRKRTRRRSNSDSSRDSEVKRDRKKPEKFDDEKKQARYEEFLQRQKERRAEDSSRQGSFRETNLDARGRRRGNGDGRFQRNFERSSRMEKIGLGHEKGTSLRRLPEFGLAKSECQRPCKTMGGYCVFVSGIHEETSKDELEDRFFDYGTVNKLVLPRHRQTGKLRGYAVVVFEHAADAKEAIDEVNNTELMGETVKVGWLFIE
mmetsp:Transcript_7545/g.9085  ORF Transcript_7545/g.9085 Transcript_7545/m.9085 type:complete len:279 (+) Transcript_7545:194-1030(+)